jgi:asparagine synthase (glutamine-hydrolysing)
MAPGKVAMSGIAALCCRDGRPVDRALIQRMTDAQAHRGQDGAGCWTNGPVGLGHRSLHTTPESVHERQPLADDAARLCVVLDGRIDNRADLRAALKDKGAPVRADTDAELVLRAYAVWGEDCPRYLIGDFAFALWDGRRRSLFCARDFLGIKPFYYHADGRTFRCASELPALFEDRDVGQEPNEGLIGEYLASAVTHQTETLYRGVFRLAPGHALVAGTDGIRITRYWNGSPGTEIRYGTDAEYAEHFLEIFREAVRCRLRSLGPVGAELSGGLDSSSVVGAVQSLYHTGHAVDAGFETFSLVFPGLACDESVYIRDVAAFWGLKSNLLESRETDSRAPIREALSTRGVPGYPNSTMSYSVYAAARAKGFQVLLSGSGGDDWLTGSLQHSADLLRGFRLGALIRRSRLESQMPSVILPPLPLLRTALWPLLPLSARRVVRRLLGRTGIPRWMNPAFARKIRLADRLRAQQGPQGFPTYAQDDIYRAGTSGWQSQCTELADLALSRVGLEIRHPFLDSRVVGFGLAVPEGQRWRGEETKFVLRQAMRGLMPETVRRRPTKADFSHVFPQALEALGGRRRFETLAVTRLGWVDADEVCRMYGRMDALRAKGDAGYASLVWPLWMILAIDIWFSAVFPHTDVNYRG